MKKKLSALIIPLLSVLVLSMFASTYLVPTVGASNGYEYEYTWDVYMDWYYGYPILIDVESNLEWVEELLPGVVTIPEQWVEDGWLVQHYIVYLELDPDYKVWGKCEEHFVLYWKLPWEWYEVEDGWFVPLPTENYGYRWFEAGEGYFAGIEGDGEVLVEWVELELPPDDPLKVIICQRMWGTINIGDPE